MNNIVCLTLLLSYDGPIVRPITLQYIATCRLTIKATVFVCLGSLLNFLFRTVPRPSNVPLTRRPKKPSRPASSRNHPAKEKQVKKEIVKPDSKENSSTDSSSEDEKKSIKSVSIKSEKIGSKSAASDDLSNKEDEPLSVSLHVSKEDEKGLFF